jgi:putative hydrolase of the HAD superfamily
VQFQAPTVVCFDLGGVLVGHCRSWAEGCERAGVPVHRTAGVASEEAFVQGRAAVDLYQRGKCGTAEYYARLVAALDGLYRESEVARVHQAWLDEDEYPGVELLVRELNADPLVTTACLSNTNAAHWAQLAGPLGRSKYPACARLQHRLASHELGCAKPDARVFTLAEERLGRPAARILFFDDTLSHVEAARRAGWRAELIDHQRDTAGQLRRWLHHYGWAGCAPGPTAEQNSEAS